MNILELVDKRNAKIDELSNLVNLGEVEKRKLNDAETLNLKEIDDEISALNAQIKEVQDQKSEVNITNRDNKVDMEKRVSLIGAINERMNGSKEVIALSTEERAITATGSAVDAIATDTLNILEPLRNALVLVQAGATFMSGLKNNITVPLYSGATALWEGENASAQNGEGAITKFSLKPKRLTTYVDISKQALTQDTVGMEALIMADIVKALSIKLEKTIFGTEAASETQPGGFFATAPSIAGTATFKQIVSLETAVDVANAAVGNMKYITNAGGRGVLKTTLKAPGQAIMLLDGTVMNGYDTLVTNAVAKDLQTGVNEFGVVFGNWNDFVVAQWGNIDLVVDGFSQSLNGVVRIVVSAFFDAAPRRAESFKTASIK